MIGCFVFFMFSFITGIAGRQIGGSPKAKAEGPVPALGLGDWLMLTILRF